MTKKDILEIKRRFKKDDCTFTRMCGCYVDAGKQKVTKISETFLNLDEDEFFKYLEIAKKTMSGSVGNNILELDFPTDAELSGGKQQFLMALRESKLKNEELLDRFYDLIIESYDYVGNYLILLFHDVYDVVTKTSDNLKVDESEEVFEYLLCAICPVVLSKPGLGYLENEHRIGARIRDWVVGVPDTGFMFPDFTERSADIHKLAYYVRDAKDSHPEFIENALGCDAKRTATEQKNCFKTVVKRVLGPDNEEADDIFMDIQETLQEECIMDEDAPDAVPILATPKVMSDMLAKCNLTPEQSTRIASHYEEAFSDEAPVLQNLIDEKAIAANAVVKEKKDLTRQVAELKQELKDTRSLYGVPDSSNEASGDDVKTYDVILRVKPEKETQIKSDYIDGQKCIIIPLGEDEHINLNGRNRQV